MGASKSCTSLCQIFKKNSQFIRLTCKWGIAILMVTPFLNYIKETFMNDITKRGRGIVSTILGILCYKKEIRSKFITDYY